MSFGMSVGLKNVPIKNNLTFILLLNDNNSYHTNQLKINGKIFDSTLVDNFISFEVTISTPNVKSFTYNPYEMV